MKNKLIPQLALSIAVCLAVGFFSSLATQSSVNTWYTTLNKPIFNPPNWLFAPVWIMLYVLMGVAAALVWNKGFYHKWVKTALYHFAFQLLLNASWSLAFFGLHQVFLALLIILTLFVFLIFTIKWFKVVTPLAGYLLIPYIIWIGYAAALNFMIWKLN
ncbi:MAG: TspO/MBR family protein [Leeuwenhoekiella sp.]